MSGGFYIDLDDWFDQGVLLIITGIWLSVAAQRAEIPFLSGFMLAEVLAIYVVMLARVQAART